MEEQWGEASMGFFLSGRDINGILALNGTNEPKLEGNDATGKMKRVIQDFCDASAISAFTRFHVRMGTIINDHMTLNSQVSSGDKAKVMQLYNRVSQQLELAKMDQAASSGAQNILMGTSIQMDRRNTAAAAAAVTGAISMANQGAVATSTALFGAPTYFHEGGGGGTGRTRTAASGLDSELARVADPLDRVLPISSHGR
jgi:hypothetical protein